MPRGNSVEPGANPNGNNRESRVSYIRGSLHSSEAVCIRRKGGPSLKQSRSSGTSKISDATLDAKSVRLPKFRRNAQLEAWIAIQATSGRWTGVRQGCLLISLVLVPFLVTFLLMCITYESSHPRCMKHSHCKLGEWCSPSHSGNVNPGICFDCYTTQEAVQTGLISVWRWQGMENFHVDENYFPDAFAWCNKTDTMPDRCDHLVYNRGMLTPTMTFLVSLLLFMVPSRSLQSEVCQGLNTTCPDFDCPLRQLFSSTRRSFPVNQLGILPCTIAMIGSAYAVPKVTRSECHIRT